MGLVWGMVSIFRETLKMRKSLYAKNQPASANW